MIAKMIVSMSICLEINKISKQLQIIRDTGGNLVMYHL